VTTDDNHVLHKTSASTGNYMQV